MADAAATLKRVTMELGGKSPMIVFDDADLEQAVAGAMMANFFTQGEVCTNGTRVFVQEAVHDAFVEQLLARVARLKLGDPLDPSTQVGALISREHLDACSVSSNGALPAGRTWPVAGAGRPIRGWRAAASSNPRCSSVAATRWRSSARRSSGR